MITGAVLLAQLRAHRRLAALVIGAVVIFLAGRVSVRQPTITAHQTEQVHQQAAEQHQEQIATTAQQATTAATTEHVDEQRHAHVHQVERVTRAGAKVVTTDTTFDDEVHVDEAQQVDVAISFSSLAQLSGESSSSADVHRESTVVQTPADAPRVKVDFLAGLSTRGPVYGGAVSARAFTVPLVKVPVYVGLWALTAPAGGVSIGLQF